ncbi:MAG: peptide chain release factor N(5)-glutamine methyltransferase [Armatimonadetes bacterium]|nr:peptide chain release factor N(5)-glutamine methyltransferase [Armatimonadota bacterium]
MGETRATGRALREAAGRLRDAGIERPRVDAELLLCHVLGVGRPRLIAHADRILSPAEHARFEGLVARRSARQPLPYLTGEREFMGLRFRVNAHVLIPRPETEVLVEAAIAAFGAYGSVEAWECGGHCASPSDRTSALPHSHTPFAAADIGTGSGAIAVSLAHAVPGVRVYATDISPEACAVARENARRLGVAERVAVVEGDLLQPLEDRCGPGVPPEERAAVICANLPYIPDESLAQLQPEVRDWEPRLALAGGPGGLRLVERLLAAAPSYLRPGGRVLCEIGPEADQPRRLLALLARTPGWGQAKVLSDLAGLPRVLSVIFEGGERHGRDFQSTQYAAEPVGDEHAFRTGRGGGGLPGG